MSSIERPKERKARQVGDVSVVAGRVAGQLQWYKFASQFVCGKTVLDVGCGLGKGLDILATVAGKTEGIDLDPRLERPGINIKTVHEISDKSYDVVVCIEVIEHVEKDEDFVRNLGRIAKEKVFVTTPNWTITRCEWPYHVREYTPKQLELLLSMIGKVQLFKGNATGAVVRPVRYPLAYHFLNDLRIYPATAFLTRCVNHFLPISIRLHGHNAALVTIK